MEQFCENHVKGRPPLFIVSDLSFLIRTNYTNVITYFIYRKFEGTMGMGALQTFLVVF